MVSEESCLRLTCSSDNVITALPVEELHSVQGEADSRIILHCLFASAALDSRGTVLAVPQTRMFSYCWCITVVESAAKCFLTPVLEIIGEL